MKPNLFEKANYVPFVFTVSDVTNADLKLEYAKLIAEYAKWLPKNEASLVPIGENLNQCHQQYG